MDGRQTPLCPFRLLRALWSARMRGAALRVASRVGRRRVGGSAASYFARMLMMAVLTVSGFCEASTDAYSPLRA